MSSSSLSRSWLAVLAVTLASVACGYWLTDVAMSGRSPAVEAVDAVAEVTPSPEPPTPAASKPMAALPPAPVAVVASPATTVPEPVTPAATSPTPAPPPLQRAWVETPVTPEPEPDIEDETPAEEPVDAPLASELAFDDPDMRAMDPDDEDYDEVVEALQRFHEFEKEIRSYEELTPEAWQELQARHLPETEALLDRAAALNLAGHPAEAESLMLEWDLLEAKYAKKVK